MAGKKSWLEKLHSPGDLPKTVNLAEKPGQRWGSGMMVVPAPLEVDAIMKLVPKGRLITSDEIRSRLAVQHGVNVACPLTTGIFIKMAAFAAEEQAAAGVNHITPYWRTLKAGGELNDKLPGGIEQQRALLEMEGHRVFQKGKRWLVADYESKLAAES